MEEPTPKTSREDRFRKLEAKQREKEGLTPVGVDSLTHSFQRAQDPDVLRDNLSKFDSDQLYRLTLSFPQCQDHPHSMIWTMKV